MNTFKRKALFAALMVGLLASGCSTMNNLSSEQITAMAGTQSSVCVTAPGWNGSSVQAHFATFGGKSVGTGGGGGTSTCGSSTVTFVNEGRAGTASNALAVKP